MSRSGRLKEKNGESNMFSVGNYDDESAARTRPISFEEIMLRRRNKESLENVKDPAEEARNISPGGSTEKIADHIESARYKYDKSSSFGREERGLEDIVNVASTRKKAESTFGKEDDLSGGEDRANRILEAKPRAELNKVDRTTKEKTGKEMLGLRKNEQISGNSEYEGGNKHTSDSVKKDRHAEIDRPRSERKTKKKNHTGDDENLNEYHTEKKHDKDIHDRGKMKKRLKSEVFVEKKHHRDSNDKDRRPEGKAKYEREIKRKYRNGDDETQDRNATRKQDLVKHHNQRIQQRKERRENVKSYHEESTAKRRRSRSREREDRRRRRSPSFSPMETKQTNHDGGRNELPMLSVKDISDKKHSDVDRSRVSTNGSSSHHQRHGGSTRSGLGGYSPRKRKSEAAAKTPSPSKNSLEKKRAGWDLPPVGTDNPSPAFISSSIQLPNQTVLSNMQNVDATSAVGPAIVKPLPMSFLNDVSTGKNATIDSVQLTQATRPMRRIYLENLPASASEKAVTDCFNNLLLSAGVNHIQQAQPCISCILYKDRGQALVEFLTAEDASTALSFDGRTLFGSVVKIRRPKEYIEVATGEPERSVDDAVAISDVVIDSPDKIYIGGISSHVSSEMLLEIVGAFGSLKAYHYEIDDNNGSCAFLEYVDHSVTIKACAGLNGMKLGGEVLTVVQAMPDALPLGNEGKPSYGIPEHAKPLLRKPTEVLKIKNVFAVESISSLSDMAIEEVLEDVRLECARFGTIKSLNVVKHSIEKNLAAKSEFEVISKVDSEEASQDSACNVDGEEPIFSEKVTCPKSDGTSGTEFCSEKELEEDKVDGVCSVELNAGVFDDKSFQEQLARDTTCEDTGDKSIPTSIIQECPDYQETPKDGPESLDKMVANNSTGLDIEKKTEGGDVDSKDTGCMLQKGSSERGASSESVDPKECIDKEDETHNNVFEQGSVLVEYGRIEACRSAAHCLHGRFFDGRMVTVEYVSLSQYKARFKK